MRSWCRYTRRSVNLHREYEGYAWKVNKDGETVGIEDPKCPNHLMSCARYGLTTLVPRGSMYDSGRQEREQIHAGSNRRTGRGRTCYFSETLTKFFPS